MQDMSYFTGPSSRTLYYLQGWDEVRQSTAVGRIVPNEELPSDVHLSQLSQGFLEEEPSKEGYLESSHTFTLLKPTFKQIICLATADQGLASYSYEELKALHKTLLTKLAINSEPQNKENTPKTIFCSSNLQLDADARSNKQIRPRGELEKSKSDKR